MERCVLHERFVRDFAHDVSSKIALIRLLAMGLLQDALIAESPSVSERLGSMLGQAEDAIALMEALCEPYLAVEPEQVNVPVLVEWAIAFAEIPTDVKLDVNVSPDLPALSIQRPGLTKAFLALLAHANQALSVYKGTRRMWIKVGLPTESLLELSVSYNGTFIPRNRWQSIFERFEFTEAKVGQAGGYQLGLWAARTFLVRCGGDIQVTESSEQKTTFVACLPVIS